MKCDVGHQIISFGGSRCPLCIALAGMDGALKCLEHLGNLFNDPKKVALVKQAVDTEQEAIAKRKLLRMPNPKR